VGVALAMIGVAFLMDELWARGEKRKRFNWLTLFDNLTVPFLMAPSIEYYHYAKGEPAILPYNWPVMTVVCLVSVAAALVLEWKRPFNPAPRDEAAPTTEALEQQAELEAQIHKTVDAQGRWVYWEKQNPWWLRVVVVVSVAAMGVGAWACWQAVQWAAWMQLAGLVMLAAFWGGFKVRVTGEELRVLLGFSGIPVLKVKLADVAEVEVRKFSPLADFGGWGIRYNGKTTAYFLSGSRGVELKLKNGKQYLIGSDTPERLKAVVASAVAELEG